MSELLTLDEAARRARVSRRTLEREIRDKRLAKTKIRGGSFVAAAELERYLIAKQQGRLA